MNYLKCVAFACPLMLAALLAEAQDKTVSLMEDEMEVMMMDDEDNRDWEDELEELSHRLQEPINLNTATKRQLEQIPFLSDIQIENLLAYIYTNGQMQTLYELQMVEDMDKRTIDRLLPFVCVRAVEERKGFPKLRNIARYGKHELLTRLDLPFYTRKGYEKNYLGTKQYHSVRYAFHYGDYLQAGFTAEKDAGEPMFALHNGKGYDYYSFYFLLKDLGRLRTLAVGNYRLNYGQGLVLGSNFSAGKTYTLPPAEPRAKGITKHSSTDEFNYFRGAAATVGLLPSLELSAFYSHRSLDATLKGDSATSIAKTGLHRTQAEADKRGNLTMQMAGGHVTFEKSSFKAGVTGIYYFFSRPYEPNLREYSKHYLRGNHFYNASLDYHFRKNGFSWTGEAAIGKKGCAFLNRLRYNFSADYRLLVAHRYYSHDYWAFFARAFGESSAPQNENGWYVAAEAQPFARWTLFASADFCSFPWWKYRISKPSQAFDTMVQATYTPRSSLLTMYLNYRYKRKERDVTGTGGACISPVCHHRLRYRLTYTPGTLTLRTTIDYNYFRQQDVGEYSFQPKQGWGFTLYASYAFPKFPLSVSAQGTYFFTDDYDSRIYASERGLLYTFNSPSYNGRGYRYTAFLRYDLNRHFMFIAKWGQTIYQDRDIISSGNDLIDGNRKSDLQLQFRVKF